MKPLMVLVSALSPLPRRHRRPVGTGMNLDCQRLKRIQYMPRMVRHHSMIDSPMPTLIPVAGAGASATANLLYWTERAQAQRGGGWITLVNRPIDRHDVLTGVNGGQRDFPRPAESVH